MLQKTGIVGGSDGAAKGAALIASLGAGYGFYTDKQEAKLRQELKGTGVKVSRHGDEIRLIMSSNITFGSSQAEIKSSFYKVLDSVGKVLTEFGQNAVEVVGHTDATGGDAINIPLSFKRAESISDYLESKGISETRISHKGEGSNHPVADNGTAEGRAVNRRVEINLVPLSSVES